MGGLGRSGGRDGRRRQRNMEMPTGEKTRRDILQKQCQEEDACYFYGHLDEWSLGLWPVNFSLWWGFGRSGGQRLHKLNRLNEGKFKTEGAIACLVWVMMVPEAWRHHSLPFF